MEQEIFSTVITSLVSAFIAGAITYIITVRKAVKALKEGLLSLLRADLIRSHDKYTKKEYCPLYAKEALEKEFKAYHALGGNGAMERVFNETMALPIDKEV